MFAAITNPGAASSSSAGLPGGTGDDAPLITLRCLGEEPTVTDEANLKGGKQNDDVDKEEKKKKKQKEKNRRRIKTSRRSRKEENRTMMVMRRKKGKRVKK